MRSEDVSTDLQSPSSLNLKQPQAFTHKCNFDTNCFKMVNVLVAEIRLLFKK